MRLDPRLSQSFMKALLWTLTGFTLFLLVFIIANISIKGLPQVTMSFLFEDPLDMGRAGGIFSTIVATVYVTVLAILLATPLGVGSAIYLTEYTRESWITRMIRFGAECLAGVPSIILGLFGFVLFVMKLGFGWSILSGGLTLAIMVLPIIIRTSEEAIKAVPQDYRLVCYSLGMSKWQTITRIVLPVPCPASVPASCSPSAGRSGKPRCCSSPRARPCAPRRRCLIRAAPWRCIFISWPGKASPCPSLRHRGHPDDFHPAHQRSGLQPDAAPDEEVFIGG